MSASNGQLLASSTSGALLCKASNGRLLYDISSTRKNCRFALLTRHYANIDFTSDETIWGPDYTYYDFVSFNSGSLASYFDHNFPDSWSETSFKDVRYGPADFSFEGFFRTSSYGKSHTPQSSLTVCYEDYRPYVYHGEASPAEYPPSAYFDEVNVEFDHYGGLVDVLDLPPTFSLVLAYRFFDDPPSDPPLRYPVLSYFDGYVPYGSPTSIPCPSTPKSRLRLCLFTPGLIFPSDCNHLNFDSYGLTTDNNYYDRSIFKFSGSGHYFQ